MQPYLGSIYNAGQTSSGGSFKSTQGQKVQFKNMFGNEWFLRITEKCIP